jgi:hypothetical protein
MLPSRCPLAVFIDLIEVEELNSPVDAFPAGMRRARTEVPGARRPVTGDWTHRFYFLFLILSSWLIAPVSTPEIDK